MWIDVKTNLPDSETIVLVRMDDGTQEKNCFPIAEYYNREFWPVNVHSSYDGAGEPVLDFPVVAWKHPENWS